MSAQYGQSHTSARDEDEKCRRREEEEEEGVAQKERLGKADEDREKEEEKERTKRGKDDPSSQERRSDFRAAITVRYSGLGTGIKKTQRKRTTLNMGYLFVWPC